MVKVINPIAVFLFVGALIPDSEAVSGRDIAAKADKYIGSTAWSFASTRRTGRNTNKCNIFVAEILEWAGASVPHRRTFWGWRYRWSPIGAYEWANPDSSYLTKDKCWSNVRYPRIGDVIAEGGHVGIMTGYRKTTSASSSEQKVVKNDWGFRRGQTPTYWRYTC